MIWAFIDVFQGHDVLMLNPEGKKKVHTWNKYLRHVSTKRHAILKNKQTKKKQKNTHVIIATSSKTESKHYKVMF